MATPAAGSLQRWLAGVTPLTTPRTEREVSQELTLVTKENRAGRAAGNENEKTRGQEAERGVGDGQEVKAARRGRARSFFV